MLSCRLYSSLKFAAQHQQRRAGNLLVKAAGMGEDGVKDSVGLPSDHQPIKGASSSSPSPAVRTEPAVVSPICNLLAQSADLLMFYISYPLFSHRL